MLLASWTELPPGLELREGYQVVELFAGKRRVARLGHALGLVTAAHDITYDPHFSEAQQRARRETPPRRSSMDINESADFLFLHFFDFGASAQALYYDDSAWPAWRLDLCHGHPMLNMDSHQCRHQRERPADSDGAS